MLGPVLITVDKKSEKRFESVVESDKGGGGGSLAVVFNLFGIAQVPTIIILRRVYHLTVSSCELYSIL